MNSRRMASAKWVGATARILRRVYGSKSPATLFTEKARQILRETKVSGPPFDPFEYAHKLGITVQEKEDMVIDGLLQRNDQCEFVVHLKKNAPKYRKNFTLAHEISHTFFYDLLTHPMSFRSNSSFDPEEERLCDLAAAELLMPCSVFKRDLLKNSDITPKTLLELSNLYEISLQAVAIRAVGVIQNLACSIWKLQGPAIDLHWITPSKLNRLTLCQTGKSSVEQAIDQPGEEFTCLDSFYGGRASGRMMGKTASFRLRSGQVLSVITLPKNQSECLRR